MSVSRMDLVDAGSPEALVKRILQAEPIKRHPELTPSRHEDLTPMLISHA